MLDGARGACGADWIDHCLVYAVSEAPTAAAAAVVKPVTRLPDLPAICRHGRGAVPDLSAKPGDGAIANALLRSPSAARFRASRTGNRLGDQRPAEPGRAAVGVIRCAERLRR